MKQLSEKTADILLLLVITALAAWLRLAHSGQPSLWWDEFITLGASLRPLGESLLVLKNFGPSDVIVEMFPPLHHIVTHALLLAGGSDAVLRLPGLLAGVATVPALYILARGPLGRLSAFTCALLLALSVYHIHYSRELRPYALFMLENILALHVLRLVLTQARIRMALVYGGLVAAMFYTSYMATILVSAQMLFAAGFLAVRSVRDRTKRGESFRIAGWLALALGCAVMAYLPWASSQAVLFKALQAPSQSQTIPFSFVAGTLKEFASFAYRGDFPAGWLLAGLGVSGFAVAVVRQGPAFPLMMALWGFMPVAAIVLAQTRMDLSSRYVFPVFMFLVLFGGHFLAECIAMLGRCFFGAGPAIFAARAVAAGVVCVLVSAPNLESLGEYYSRESSSYKQLMSYLMENRNNTDVLLFAHPRQLKLIAGWYAGETFSDVRQISGAGYFRAFMISPRSVNVAGLQGAVSRGRIVDTEIVSLGVARAGVVPIAPDDSGQFVYGDNFTSMRFLEDVHESHNVGLSLEHKVLTPYDAGRSGWCEYLFRSLNQNTVSSAQLTFDLALVLNAGEDSDAVVRIGVAAGSGEIKTVHEASIHDFKDESGRLLPADQLKVRHAKIDLDLTGHLAGAEDVRLRIDFGPSMRAGAIEISGMQMRLVPAGPAHSKVRGLSETLSRIPLAAWTPGRQLVLSNALYAFSVDGVVTAGDVGTPQERASFMRENPNATPVRVLRYPDGNPGVELYDPALANPYVRVLPSHGSTLGSVPDTARSIRTLRLSGVMDNPQVELGKSRLAVPVSSKSPGVFTMTDAGEAEYTLTPLFTRREFDAAKVESLSGARKIPDEDCITCDSPRPCSVTYGASLGFPVRFVRVLAYPRVVSAPDGRNTVRTLLSTNGTDWREINVYKGAASGRWEGLKIPQYTMVSLDQPASRVLIRFELSGQDAQLWSAHDAAMRLDFRLSSPQSLFAAVESWPTNLNLSNPEPLDVMLLRERLQFPDSLKRTR